MTDLPARINQFLSANTYADIHTAMSQAVALLRECAINMDGYEEEYRNLRAQRDHLFLGIRSIIIQCRQSAVLGDDARAVADELETLIAEGCDG